MTRTPATDPGLVAELRQLIDGARRRAAAAVNAELTLQYWQVGDRIRREILGEKRAGYGEAIVSALGRQLTAEYLTVLPPREALQARLYQSIENARARLRADRQEGEADE